MNHPTYLPIFELVRNGVVESTHFGAIAVADVKGNLISSYGDPSAVTFLRSSAKPIQAIALIEKDGVSRYKLTQKEIAVICASHSGTDEHFDTLRRMQNKIGISEADLLCGVHPPGDPATEDALHKRGEQPTPNRHNCSGNHTGIIAFARLMAGKPDWETDDLQYTDAGHPAQRHLLELFAEMAEIPPDEVASGVDGCSILTYAVSLLKAAQAYARLCDPGQLSSKRAEACRSITSSMTAFPEMVGGLNSFDTHLMRATQGRIISKGGAEGYQAMGLLPGILYPGSPGVGITIKISDGDLGSHYLIPQDYGGRARTAVALEVLRQLGVLSASDLIPLTGFGPSFHLYNYRMIETGNGRPCFSLESPN
jgi:L-asparaginase II